MSEWIESARKSDDETNTFAGLALHSGVMVGLHLLKRFEEWDQVGVHVAGLWVAQDYRGHGIARKLKIQGEEWARNIGATFMNTNVHPSNHRMLAMNERAGFSVFRYNLRKRL